MFSARGVAFHLKPVGSHSSWWLPLKQSVNQVHFSPENLKIQILYKLLSQFLNVGNYFASNTTDWPAHDIELPLAYQFALLLYVCCMTECGLLRSVVVI